MSGTKTDSQPKSSSTERPPELETPQEIADYTSDLPGLVPARKAAPQPPKITHLDGPSVREALESQLASLGQQGISMPRIRVVEDGKETVGELDVGLINMVTQLGQLGQLSKIRKSLEREQFLGKLLSTTLAATDEYQALDLTKQDPFIPWISATFVNKGPDSVYLAINRQRPFHKLDKGDSLPADFAKAEERIYFIEYQCDSGNAASLRCLGKY